MKRSSWSFVFRRWPRPARLAFWMVAPTAAVSLAIWLALFGPNCAGPAPRAPLQSTRPASAPAPYAHIPVPDSLPADYRLRRHDVLVFEVNTIPSDGTSTVETRAVAEDGAILIAGLGSITAEGRTVADVEQAVVDAYARLGQKKEARALIKEIARPPESLQSHGR